MVDAVWVADRAHDSAVSTRQIMLENSVAVHGVSVGVFSSESRHRLPVVGSGHTLFTVIIYFQ